MRRSIGSLLSHRTVPEDVRTTKGKKRGTNRRRIRKSRCRSRTPWSTRSVLFRVADHEEKRGTVSQAIDCANPHETGFDPRTSHAGNGRGGRSRDELKTVNDGKRDQVGRTEDHELRSRTSRRISWETESPSPERFRFRCPFPRPSKRNGHLFGWMDERAKIHVQVGLKKGRVHPVERSERFEQATKSCYRSFVRTLTFPTPVSKGPTWDFVAHGIPNDIKTDRMGASTDAASWPPAFARHAFRILMRTAFGKDWQGPQHVAFVMDGNRRHADEKGFDREAGHARGFQALLRALGWCFELGIRHVSAYAFSIENFRRDRREVEALMDLAEAKLDTIADDPVLREHDVRVRVLGDLVQLPEGVQRAAKNAMKSTVGREGAVLDIFLAYASRDEMAKAVDRLQGDVLQNRLQASSSDQAQLNARMMNNGSPPVDLLLRTSGECRLSDFLLAQSSHAHLVFLDVLWPELGYWDLAGAILQHSIASTKCSPCKKNALESGPPIETVCRRESWSISKKFGA